VLSAEEMNGFLNQLGGTGKRLPAGGVPREPIASTRLGRESAGQANSFREGWRRPVLRRDRRFWNFCMRGLARSELTASILPTWSKRTYLRVRARQQGTHRSLWAKPRKPGKILAGARTVLQQTDRTGGRQDRTLKRSFSIFRAAADAALRRAHRQEIRV